MTALIKTARAGVLDIAYEETGNPNGQVAILLHGFPYDVRAFDEVVPPLAAAGLRVIVPYLRGFGPTRFAGSTTMRSGQQAALAHDLLELIDALGTDDAFLAGYDWGGRAACLVAALWPDRAAGLVSGDGYNIQNIPQSGEPIPPAEERSLWYQYYFHSERGRLGLERNRDELCELLWRTWSPTWAQASEAYPRSAPSLRNPDFVPVAIHSYRHRYGLVPGDPRYQATEDKIAKQPRIGVPTVVLEGGADGVLGPSALGDRDCFTGPYQHVHLPETGHNLPQEAPREFADAVLSLAR